MRGYEELLADADDLLSPFRDLALPKLTPQRLRQTRERIIEITASENPLRPPANGIVALAGDWHGNGPFALAVLDCAAARGARTVIVLGDFGLYSDFSAQGYLDALSEHADALGLTVLWIDGNHEDFDLLQRYPVIGPGFPGAGLRPVRPYVWHLPRGTRWTWPALDAQGQPTQRTWLALGGAISVNRSMLTPGHSWWPAEAITIAQAEAVIAAGPADVMLTHDRPAAAASVMGQAAGVWSLTAPKGWTPQDMARADEHSALLQTVVDAVRPEHLWHGHLHQRHDVGLDLLPMTEPGRDRTWVHGLAHDKTLADNLVLVGLGGDYLIS